jgi:SulP family sulfate permease
MLSGGVVALFVGIFGTLLKYIPTASLAALLLATALRMIDWRQVILCWRATRADAAVLLITISSCVFLSLPIAFYIGVVLSIILYLQKAASPRVIEYTYHEETKELRQAKEEEKKAARPFRIINVEGELFFGSVDLFQHTLRAMAEDDATTKGIILRLKHVHDLDASTALALKQLKDYLNKSGRFLVVYGIPHHVWELLVNTRLVDHLGEENLILFEEKAPHTALSKAIARAHALLMEPEGVSLAQGPI